MGLATFWMALLITPVPTSPFLYDVKIKSITGYGTPVVDDQYTITTPVVPEDDKETFVAAEINILSWRLVSNEVDL